MALSILRNGVPLDQLYGTKGASTAAATGCLQNGVDVNQYLLALADGKALGFNSGLSKNGTDFSAIFGIPNSNTPLPINGQTFTTTSQSGTGPSSSSVLFRASTSGWTVSGTSSSGGSTPTASGALPTGAVSVQYAYTITTTIGAGTVTNGAPAAVTLTSTNVNFSVGASSTPSTGDNERQVALTITFYNASSQAISTSTITLYATATGAA